MVTVQRFRSTAKALSAASFATLLLVQGPAAVAQPMQLPGAGGVTPPGTVVAPPPPGPAATPRAPAGPARSTAAPRAVADDAVVGQALQHQGAAGRLVMERIPGGYGLKFQMEGFQVNNLLEPCGVSFGEQAVPLDNLGRPEGLPRYRLRSSVCPIVFDVLNNAMLVVEPQTPCVIEAAQCRLNPRGLWAPDGRGLVALAAEITRQRSTAEAQVRDGFRLLGERAAPEDKRQIAREQAGFSSEREQICREFSREVTHGFCATKVTEARAASLNARLQALTAKPARR